MSRPGFAPRALVLSVVAAGVVFVACGGAVMPTESRGSSSVDGTKGVNTSSGSGSSATPAVCVYPPGASTTDDGSTVGCRASPSGSDCEVSSGATVLADGGVINGTATCTSFCNAAEYELTCSSGGVSHPPLPIPDPDPSLGCTIVPIPTPMDILFYCCPCASP